MGKVDLPGFFFISETSEKIWKSTFEVTVNNVIFLHECRRKWEILLKFSTSCRKITFYTL